MKGETKRKQLEKTLRKLLDIVYLLEGKIAGKDSITMSRTDFYEILHNVEYAIDMFDSTTEKSIVSQAKELAEGFKEDGCYPSTRNTVEQVIYLAKEFSVDPEAMLYCIRMFAEANEKAKAKKKEN